jgi:hypothetical protein
MSNKNRSSHRLRFLPTILLFPLLLSGCGEGWDAYKDLYEQDPGPPPEEPWVGDETVFVKLGGTEVETPLEGIVTSDFLGSGSVRLSDLIAASEITATPEAFRYDFTATDGYNLLVKLEGNLSLLPDWENMQHGFLYRTGLGDLETGWDPQEQPWGSAVSAYNVKYMNGGLIELLTP